VTRAASPGDGAVVVRKRAGGPVGAEQGEAHGLARRLGHGARAAVAVELGRGVAGAGGVDLDAGALELLGERDRDRVERALRRPVGDTADAAQREGRAADGGERADAARDVDDAPGETGDGPELICARARALATTGVEPYSLAMTDFGAGTVVLIHGRTKASVEFLARSEDELARRCVAVT
jgi:hypothetical protein